MLAKRVFVAALVLAAFPGAALARPRTIARTGRVDFGPVLAGSRVLVAASPRVLVVTPNGKATTLRGVDSPEVAQRPTAHAATPEGSLIVTGGPLAVSAGGIAWQASSDQVDPSGDRQKFVSGYLRAPLIGGSDQLLGGFSGIGGPSDPLAECHAAAGQSPRRFFQMGLSSGWLGYVVEEPPGECPRTTATTTLKLIVRSVAGGQLGPERLLGEAPNPGPGGSFPFAGVRVAGDFIAWLSPSAGAGTSDLTVVDARTGSSGYEVTGLSPNGMALGADGTVAVGATDGSSAWVSPAEPTLQPLGRGLPRAIAGRTVLLQAGRSLVLQSLDGARRPLVSLKRGERRAGTADYNGTYATWATRRRVCTRKHHHRRCKRADDIVLQRVG